ncbi:MULTISPECIES: pyocin knob domain-containing protein [Pseudomonas]|uniref:Phage tail protein n=1 Tax=Pseudomonas jessenii TaxID=77298 RepID=A0A370S151_PSEJE|nr:MULTISPECIES: pyocin knob domain-containing protein [Pseudomonas]RDL13480.1 hypothetical protein DEU51_12577 [Pseudomonas jessenii]CEL30190.1 hypothetical protein SRM1_03548 [Pseudomonas fluorescens]
MPWHRLGTVSVTQNSNVVTGVNTAFAANTRVGDAFVGPDGRQYELSNVASDTVISINPPYLGATASGATYAVAPIQGYQKGLADEVRSWNNSYGQKMAALGTTGNYDILPVNKGGTGGNSQATARTGLGLGNSATAALVASLTDSTPGRVLLTGYGGLGYLDNAPFSGVNQAPGGYRVGGAYVGQFVNPQFGTMTGYLKVYAGTDNQSAAQTFINQGNGQLFTRAQTGGVWGAWRAVYDTSNTTRAADGTLKGI